MSYPSLPSTIPACALRADWSMMPVNPLRRTDMDEGAVAVERRVSRLTGIQTLSWELTGPQYDLLVTFWAEDLDAGTAWFYAPAIEGIRAERRLMRFAGDPPWQASSPHGGIFRLLFEAELREIPILDPAERMALELHLADADGLAALIAGLEPVVEAFEGLSTWH